MVVYTSNYWKYRGDRGVQISNSKPDGVSVYRSLPCLYPDWSMVKMWNSVKKLPADDTRRIKAWKEFEDAYWKKLNRLGAENILSYLSDGDVLLCWCQQRKECHRGILAEWLTRQGVGVEELDSHDAPAPDPARMVRRCGYFVLGDDVIRVPTDISWDLGFDRDAKSAYIKRLHSQLRSMYPLFRIEEVTSASTTAGKQLSPFYMKFSETESLEDAWNRLRNKSEFICYDGFAWTNPPTQDAFAHFYCYYGQSYLPLIREIDMFTDVFYNPTKHGGTQAEACAILKLLDLQNKLDILNDQKAFISWRNEHIIV